MRPGDQRARRDGGRQQRKAPVAASARLVALLAACLLALLLGQIGAWWLYRLPRSASFGVDEPAAFLPLRGFYELERPPSQPAGYRWTGSAAEASLPNPGGSPLLRLTLAGGPGRAVPATLTLDGRPAAAFVVAPEPRRYQALLPQGQGRRLRLGLESPTVAEGRRKLGLVVAGFGVAGAGQPPLALLGALAVGTLGACALLLQAGVGPFGAVALLLLSQGLVLGWQWAGGWRYGLAEPLLLAVGVGGLGAVLVERWLLARIPPPIPFPLAADQPLPLVPRSGVLITFPSGGQAGWWHWGSTRTRTYLALGAVLVLVLCVRVPFLAAGDPVGDLELSARRISLLAEQGLAGAYVRDGDYLPLRIYMLLGFAPLATLFDLGLYAPLPPATKLLLKLPALLADSVTIAVVFFWSLRWRGLRGAASLALLYGLAPPVWINVAWWGQVDGLLLLPMVGAVLLLGVGSGRRAWACWALALLIKPQPILLAPLMLAVTLRRHGCRGLVSGGALAAAILALGIAPLALAGQGPGLLQAYVGSVGRFPLLSNDAYNLWYLLAGGARVPDSGQGLLGISYRLVGACLLAAAALLVGVVLLKRADGPARTHAAAALALAFFCLPTQIHQRYLFLTFGFLVLRLASAPRLTTLYLLLVVTGTINILGSLAFVPALQPLIAGSWLPLAAAALNLLALAAILVSLVRLAFFPAKPAGDS